MWARRRRWRADPFEDGEMEGEGGKGGGEKRWRKSSRSETPMRV